MQILFSLRWLLLTYIRLSHHVLTAPWCRILRCTTSIGNSLFWRLVSWICGMGAYTTLVTRKIAIVIIEVLISCKWIWWSSLMISSPTRCLRIIDVIACLASINATWEWWSMSAPSWMCITATQSIIILRSSCIHLRWRWWLIHLSVSLWWVLSTILIAMTDDLFSLVVESGVLLSAWIVESIRAEKNLILCFVVRTAVRASTSLPIASSSHYQWWLACWNAWAKCLPSLLLIVRNIAIIVSYACCLIWRGCLVRIFAHDWASNETIYLLSWLRLLVMSLGIIIGRCWSTIIGSMISSISISRIILTSIEIVASASVIWHI